MSELDQLDVKLVDQDELEASITNKSKQGFATERCRVR